MTNFTPRERKYVWWLAGFTFASRVVLGLRGEVNQASRLLLDDSYYLFSCARHLALGHGITADGIHPTNGIQPLLVFLEVPFFWIAGNDRWLGVQLSFILFALFSSASVVIAARVMSHLRIQNDAAREVAPMQNPVILCAGLWAISFPLFALMMNGLETSLYSLLILLAIDQYIVIEASAQRSWMQFARFGGLLGLLILARIDALFFLLAIAVFELVRFRAASIPRIAVLGVTALLVSAPWWIYNYLGFGSFLPISGQAESIGAVDLGRNLVVALTRFANISVAAFALPYNQLASYLQILLSLAILTAVVFVIRRYRLHSGLRKSYRLDALAPFAVAGGILAIIYVAQFHAPYFLDRYFQPIRIVWFFIAAVLIAKVSWQPTSKLARYGALVYMIAATIFFAIFYSLNFTAPHVSDLYRTALWAKQHPNVIVGMEQSGVAGFTADNVWNLDGKMNPDAMRAIKAGTIAAYINSQKFSYLADWDSIVQELLVHANAVHQYKLIDSIDRVQIYQRVE
jgi:hypothetical protein